MAKKSVDLTTLSGWANLSDGNHTIKIKAKGTGYIDSELSAGVVVSKAPSTVTLEKGTYKWKDTTSLPNTNIIQSFDFTSKPYNSNVDFEKVTIETSGYIRYSTKQSSLDSFYRRPDGKWVTQNSEGDETITIGLQTITLSTAQTVSAAFYKWAITDGNLVKQVEPAAYTDCLTFTGESSEFTLKATNKEWDGTVEYSTDHNTWTVWNGTAVSSVDKKLYLRGSGNTKFYTGNGAQFVLSARAACSGNIQTLLEYSNPPTGILANNCYTYMFKGCTNLTQAPELPATTLSNSCYRNMFNGCTNITQAPELPATTLTTGCYGYMFHKCTNLTQAPELPATTLANSCYESMFNGCTSLTKAPELPATTLANYCYTSMFNGCTSLKINTSSGNKIFTCPATIPNGAVNYMFTNTGGSFTGTPTSGNTYYWTE